MLEMNRPPPTLRQAADVPAVPWRNGGGVTRELLAWPRSPQWALRVSVADISASGPFSSYPGVDRWFAVLRGGAVRLHTAGTEPEELTASHRELHAFSGDAATDCTMLGAATQDFNLMARRGHFRLRQQSLPGCPRLDTDAEGVGLFVASRAELQQESGPVTLLEEMTLAWWPNPERAQRSLRVTAAGRGWWFEVERSTRPLAAPRAARRYSTRCRKAATAASSSAHTEWAIG